MAEKKKSVESASPASDKKKALETAMAQIERAYGKGSIMRLGENAGVVVDAIPTGSLSLDIALGSTTLVVSRGLCRNLLPRVFNPPELVALDLLPAEDKAL